MHHLDQIVFFFIIILHQTFSPSPTPSARGHNSVWLNRGEVEGIVEMV